MNSQAASAEVNASIRPQAKGGSVQCFVRLLDAQEADRAKRMPDEQAALNVLFGAWLRLKELGWQDAEYCPKDGSEFKVIEAGSTGFHDCVYLGEWPTGGWWVHDGDTYPSRPILWKPNSGMSGKEKP